LRPASPVFFVRRRSARRACSPMTLTRRRDSGLGERGLTPWMEKLVLMNITNVFLEYGTVFTTARSLRLYCSWFCRVDIPYFALSSSGISLHVYLPALHL